MDKQHLFLLEAGQVIVSESPIVVRTILGSCVSVTLYDYKTGIAGIIHGLYGGKGDSPLYTETALEMMIQEFIKRDIRLQRVEVKLFGGAIMQLAPSEDEVSNAIRIKNVQSAKEVLRKYNMSITAEDTGCACGREVFFFTENGEVFVKKLASEITCTSPYCLEKDKKRCPRR